MKTQLFAILLLLISHCLFGQKGNSMIEINPYIRMDRYPQFSYVLGGRPSTDYVKIKGTSWGINTVFKFPVKKRIYIKTGVGYYKYSFTDINRYNTMFGNSNARHIAFPSPLYIIFYSDNYWYNSISFNLGIENFFNFNNNWQLVGGINFNNYYTYSQYYRITADYPTGPPDHRYKLRNSRYLGISANIHAGLLKHFGKLNIGPSLFLPVYDIWKQDNTFPEEDNASSRNKWLKGIGVGITCNFSLKK